MNRFKIVLGKEQDFESVWKNRDTHLKGVPGFKEFHLVKGNTNEEFTLYASHSIWNSKEDFINWTKSEAFRLAHKNAGQHQDLYLGAPNFDGFEWISRVQAPETGEVFVIFKADSHLAISEHFGVWRAKFGVEWNITAVLNDDEVIKRNKQVADAAAEMG